MAKMSKKQQRHALKKQKERVEKRRKLRHSAQIESGEMYSPNDSPQSWPLSHEQMLRTSIQKFAFQKTFASEVERALGDFFGDEVLQTRVIEFETPEMSAFQEWLFFDFVLSNGRRLIDLFAERKGAALPPQQQAMLYEWIETNRLRLLEVQSITPGQGEVVKDLLSGEVLHCRDISMSYGARKWAIFLARPLRTEGEWAFTGSGKQLSPNEKDELVNFARELWRQYQELHVSASLNDFYRDNSLALYRLADAINKRNAAIAYVSAEGHPLVRAEATYTVLAPAEVMARLDECEEFTFTGDRPSDTQENHYAWLLRGRSQAPEKNENLDNRVLLLQGEWTAGPGEPSYRTLGDITVTRSLLRLECLSFERLTLGRQLLEELLVGLIVHRDDSVTDLTVANAQDSKSPISLPLSQTDPSARQVEYELMARKAEQWLNTPVPALDNQTPRQAARHAEGRAKLEELLKVLEYYERDDSSMKQTPYNAESFRRELGLT